MKGRETIMRKDFELQMYKVRDEGLRLLHGLATNLATSLQTPQEA